jgi:transcriptional regulator with XRE-family HTH domain
MSEPIGKRVRYARRQKIDLAPFAERLDELLAERNLSMRKAALNAGLDHQAVRRIVMGERPTMVNCILLADYLDVNPNEFLKLASWPTLKIFDITKNQAKNLPPEVIDLALDLTKISSPEKRKKVVRAMRTLLRELAG